MLRYIVILVMSMSISFLMGEDLKAEGRCPPGQYPVGGQGMLGCAPIPGAAGGSAAPSAPTPSGKWLLTWGSVFASPTTGATGVAMGKFSESEAVTEARVLCSRKGARDCVKEISFENSCVALTDAPPSKNILGGVATGATEQEAIAASTKICRGNGASICTVSYSGCSMPVFQKF